MKLLQRNSDRYSFDLLPKDVTEEFELGINALALFAVIPENKKNGAGTESHNIEGLLQPY